MTFNNKDAKSEIQRDIGCLFDDYDHLSLRLEVISEIIEEIIEMYPEHRDKLNLEKRIQQKLMLKKLAGE